MSKQKKNDIIKFILDNQENIDDFLREIEYTDFPFTKESLEEMEYSELADWKKVLSEALAASEKKYDDEFLSHGRC